MKRACPLCGATRDLRDTGRCRDVVACARRALDKLVTRPGMAVTDEGAAYRDVPKGAG